jgi:polysaccharide export outer membrane protein
MLTITVSSEKPEAAIPFNLTVPTSMNASSGSRNLSSQPVLQTYLVDNNGYIDFPVLGKLQVYGMTKGELETMIKERIKLNFTTEPIVTVRMANYKVTVLGEVSSPGVHTINNEKVNIFEALAMSGDLTIHGRRDNVKLIRENADGTKKIVPLNLNNADIIHSPYYHLQQNDILYVEPNKAKAQSANLSNMTSMWFSATSLLMAVITFLLNLL